MGVKCLTYFVMIPVTSCGCERSFKNIKNKLRRIMGQERLDALLFLFIEQKLVTDIDIDDISDEFKTFSQKRRLAL
ncbi:zinc finger MYM-type protein 1-like [Aphis craccivora]|uniref:Zinc finger MYM-type protein 1-like n=1 Tax=Aphis craccivora TaxID=307492 RepID=A0A6G0YBA0_APHCR|nr:zinc finger MYM-type protein 1-like [Aphis craccivora]